MINRLQVGQGGNPFNNLIEDCRLGAIRSGSTSPPTLRRWAVAQRPSKTSPGLTAAVERARASDRTYLIALQVDAYTWTEGGSFWEVGVPEVSSLPSVTDARADMEKGTADQRVGW